MESTGASIRMNMDAVGLNRGVITTVSSQVRGRVYFPGLKMNVLIINNACRSESLKTRI